MRLTRLSKVTKVAQEEEEIEEFKPVSVAFKAFHDLAVNCLLNS